MNIYIDVTNLIQSNFMTGIQRAVSEFTTRLIRNEDINGMQIVLIKCVEFDQFMVLKKDKFYEFYAKEVGDKKSFESDVFIKVDDMCGDSVFLDIDAVWHNVFLRTELYPMLKKRNIKICTYVYDIITITHPYYTSNPNIVTFPAYILATLKYADIIFTSAQFTVEEMEKLAKKVGLVNKRNYKVVPLGGDFKNNSGKTGEIDPRAIQIVEKGKYIFAVSTIEPRKNYEILLDAFDKGLNDLGVQMVIAGRFGWNVEELKERIKNHPEKDKSFFHLEGMNDDTIRYLYENAYMVFFPTFIEGYGLATVEAMQYNVPVALSDIPVMHEVGGDYCDYFDPYNPLEVVEIVRKYLNNPNLYEERKNLLKNYQPYTWDQAEQDIVKAIRTQFSVHNVSVKCRQMVFLTARVDAFFDTLDFIENLMPFIEEIVVCCPEQVKDKFINKGKNRRILITIMTDEEVLAGEKLPDDHQQRNTFLRCKMLMSNRIDDVFIMSDDDYRPMFKMGLDVFFERGKYNAYFFHDLGEWEDGVKEMTSYDRGMVRTNEFLTKNGFYNLQYSSHMPQIIDKGIYKEMLREFPEILDIGVDEWSSYFNYAISKYPSKFRVLPYLTLGWPGHVSDWELKVDNKIYLFENYYENLYAPNEIFENFSEQYNSDIEKENVEKIRVFDEERQEHKNGKIIYENYMRKYNLKYRYAPSFIFEFDEKENRAKFYAPRYIQLGVNSWNKIPVILEGMSSADIKIGWSLSSIKGEEKKPVEICNVDYDRKKVLLAVRTPNEEQNLFFNLFYSINGAKFQVGKTIIAKIVKKNEREKELY